MVTLDSALDDIMQLDYESREILIGILKNRQVEYRREEIAKNIKRSLKDYRAGKLQAFTAEEVWEKLNKI